MSIPFHGFTGSSSELPNRFAGIERTVNWYVEANQSQAEAKWQVLLNPCPGNVPFSQLPVPPPFNQPNRGLIEVRGQVFGVNGNTVFELLSTGAFSLVGTMEEHDGTPCSMVANGNGQVFISSAGWGYVIPAGGLPGSLVRVGNTSGFLGAGMATFQDGYVLVIKPNSNQMQISGSDDIPLGDDLQWSAANVSIQAGQADYLRAIISSREYVWLFGARRSQVYYNVGNNGLGNFPFQSYNETFIETGISAPFSVAELGDSLVWLGEDARGRRACWRANSFAPERISTFAVEQLWQKYARVDDAIAFPFLFSGHLFYQITFPSAYVANPPSGFPLGAPATYHSTTWLFDATSSQLMGRPAWTERRYQTATGFSEGRSERFHCFGFGLHLVGSCGIDGNPGAIYNYDDGPPGYTDAGMNLAGAQDARPIVRDRIAPHIWSNNKRLIINRLELELSRGVGLDGAPAVGGNPQMVLRISRDGGKTWGPEFNQPVGVEGAWTQLVRFNRLGSGRDLVFWLRYTDPTYMSVIGAQLDAFECGV